jgi:hypothetical protein
MDVSGQLHSPAALLPEKEPLISTGKLCGPQSRSGRGATNEETSGMHAVNFIPRYRVMVKFLSK